MFEIGDKVVVKSITSNDKKDYLGNMYEIKDKANGRYHFGRNVEVYIEWGTILTRQERGLWWTDQELRLATIDDELDEIRREIKEVTSDVEEIKEGDTNLEHSSRMLMMEENSSWVENLMDSRLQFVVGYVLGLISALVAALLAGLFS